MMRSLYSAVSGLKTHQTKMDVIGNNIANVNTEAFKASSVTFQEIMYQTTSGATSGNGNIGGTNAKQIGLGVSTGSTTISIETAGAAETTGNPFDLKLSDAQTTNFFIVSDGTNTMFTRAGSFYVDGNGYLCMSSTGYILQGWQVDPDLGTIRKDIVSNLQVMSPENQTSAPEATERAYMSGVLDKNDDNVTGTGYVTTLGIYDDLGYSYTAKFNITPLFETSTTTTYSTANSAGATAFNIGAGNNLTAGQTAALTNAGLTNLTVDGAGNVLSDGNQIYTYTSTGTSPRDGKYVITLSDIIDSDSKSIIYEADGTAKTDANGNPIDITTLFGTDIDTDGNGANDTTGYILTYDENKGTFVNIGATDVNSDAVDTVKQANLTLSNLLTAFRTTEGVPTDVTSNFKDIEIDFSRTMNYDNSGTSTLKAVRGDTTGNGAGKKLGALTGISVDSDGKIFGSYDNGNTVLLCQIAAAQFANASGLEKVGENCYQTTLNSGEFDGIGVDISADGSAISTGELEMSNVDLSSEFTSMIITQRGFQANSRVITTSDTLLEELINLKR